MLKQHSTGTQYFRVRFNAMASKLLTIPYRLLQFSSQMSIKTGCFFLWQTENSFQKKNSNIKMSRHQTENALFFNQGISPENG
jgi:hypothetical protein